MANTKIDLVQGAFSKMRISGLTVDPTPEDTTLALQVLEQMAAEFAGRNITTYYREAFDQGDVDPNEQSGLALKYRNAFEANLAVRLCADFGKDIPHSLGINAQQSLSSMSSMIAADNIREVEQPHRQPIGNAAALRNRWHQKFYRTPPQPPQDAELHHMFIGDINDYKEDFTSYLKGDEVIESFNIQAESGLTILESDNVYPYITYRVEAVSNTEQGIWQMVRIIATTDAGRVTTRLINFDIRIPATLEGVNI